MSWRMAPGAIPALLMLCLSDGMHPALAGNDHAVQVKIDQRVTVVPPGVLTRAMMSAVRHPDGAIWLNTQTGPLYGVSTKGARGHRLR